MDVDKRQVKVWKTKTAGVFWTPDGEVRIPDDYEFLESGDRRLNGLVGQKCGELGIRVFVLMEKMGGQFSERVGCFVPSDVADACRAKVAERMRQEERYAAARAEQKAKEEAAKPRFLSALANDWKRIPADHVDGVWKRFQCHCLDRLDYRTAVTESVRGYVIDKLVGYRNVWHDPLAVNRAMDNWR